MNRISKTFSKLSARGEGALIPFIVCGNPDFDSSLRIAKALADGGADALEIGIPFSDPVADGDAIQRASMRALSCGMNCARALEFIGKVREFFSGPIVAMTYCNPPQQYGFGRFCDEAGRAGADAIIITDAPFEEGFDTAGLDRILLVAKNSSGQRVQKIAGLAEGFIYLVSILGTTGSSKPDKALISARVSQLRKLSTLPLCVGFGISKPKDVEDLIGAGCDGVVVGSELCRMIEHGEADAPERIREYCASLKAATKKV